MKTSLPDRGKLVFSGLAKASAIDALWHVRDYLRRHPDTDVGAAALALKRGAFAVANYDYDTALVLNDLIAPLLSDDRKKLFQTCLTGILEYTRPSWLVKLLVGRDAVRSSLTHDELKCFKLAGAFESEPDSDTLEWWDSLAALARLGKSMRLTAIGREGERLSLAYEGARVQSLGIQEKIVWVALDDERSGYDIRSYDRSQVGLVNKLIEVKACADYPLRFFVSRNEWDMANDCGTAFLFHLWHMPSKTLHEVTPDQLRDHIPQDQGQGRWENARITFLIG